MLDGIGFRLHPNRLIQQSGSSIGTGAVQSIFHGLSVSPTIVFIYVPTTGELYGAVSDSIRIYPNVPIGVSYNWMVIV